MLILIALAVADEVRLDVNAKLKTALKVAAIAIVPGLGVLWLATKIGNEIVREAEERKEFKAYILKTYGKDSEYVDRYL